MTPELDRDPLESVATRRRAGQRRVMILVAMLGGLSVPLIVKLVAGLRKGDNLVAELERRGAVYLRDGSRRDRPIIALDLDATLVDDTGRAWPRGRFGDADLARLQRLSRLESLSLRDQPISNAGLAHLAAIPRLARLDLTGTRVSKEGIAWLRRARPGLIVQPMDP